MRKITDHLGIGEKIIHQESGRITIDPTLPEEKKGTLVMTNRRIMFFVEGLEGPSKVLDITRKSVEGFRITVDGGSGLLQIKTPSIIAGLKSVTFDTIERELKADFIAEGKVFQPTRRVSVDFRQEIDGKYAIHYNDRLLGYVEIPPYFSTLFVDSKFYNPEGEVIGGIRHGSRWMYTDLLDANGNVLGRIDYRSQMSMRIANANGHNVALVTVTMKDDEYELLFIHTKDHVPLAGALMPTEGPGRIVGLDMKFYEFEDDPKYLIFSSIAIKRYLEERAP
ncbi:MAG TPA: hypothetical protein EYP43_01135 [Thermoplasmata archaeon]|nr:hypothetical protein [Thermoplasmata archaeon]